ncbi:hypothetical protein [Croceicoccus sp. YJ47]|uniref:hypothetical protein n=1 Tax=Croceicoccus sp. YJ47 TaxID=2798724 RepID=UPI0019220526|nr:hypothetical protein [Croceicoccus sp. YJ47]QQN72907.1 hypothetical protein JD971_08255 [Croceicoccus sp. YJ47]
MSRLPRAAGRDSASGMAGSGSQGRGQRAAALMRRETRVRRGAVPDTIGGERVADGQWALIGEEFLLRAGGCTIYYRTGHGICVDVASADAERRLDLYLSGTTHAAIACMNGLYPVHASAVVANGRAIGITGPSGAGKSTLSAGLASRGMGLLADDTLILAMPDGGADDAGIDDGGAKPAPVCLPGHKRMKLWPDAVAMTGAQAGDIVSPDYRKHYVAQAGPAHDEPCPLAGIVVLAQGEDFAFEPLHGGEKIAALNDDHYIARLHEVASGDGPAGRLRALVTLASAVPCWRLTRPMDSDRFAQMLDFTQRNLEEQLL